MVAHSGDFEPSKPVHRIVACDDEALLEAAYWGVCLRKVRRYKSARKAREAALAASSDVPSAPEAASASTAYTHSALDEMLLRPLPDRIVALGKWTFVVEASGSHEDKTPGPDARMLLENKMTATFAGGAVEGLSLPQENTLHEMPAGVLGYLRMKVYTVCRALEDVEIHELFDEYHLSRCAREYLCTMLGRESQSSENSGSNSMQRRLLEHIPNPRGAWGPRANPNFCMYGTAQTDWPTCPY